MSLAIRPQVLGNAFVSNYREEEIIMPAEHTGVIKENYKWKVIG